MDERGILDGDGIRPGDRAKTAQAAHGAGVTVTSIEGQGSTFSFQLSVERA